MRRSASLVSGLAAAMLVLLAPSFRAAHAADPQVERGQYLVTIEACGDCHTPGSLSGHPDKAKFLGGSDVGFAIPGLGIFVPPNLTPDPETGLGKWTNAQIVTALTTGVRPDGRVLAPIMPWRWLAHLTPADANAIAAYLKTLPPVVHQVAGPFGPNEKPSVAVMAVVPADVYITLPKPAAPSQQ